VAIEIIPKPREKKGISFSIVNILYYLVIFSVFFALLAYIGIIYFSGSAEKRLEELKAELIKKETKQVKLFEEEIFNTKQKIDIFANLLDSYKKSSAFFDFLKQNCHKKVFFSETSLDLDAGQVRFIGKAEGFRTLGEQMLIFKQKESVKNVSLSQVSLEKEGGVSFELSLSFNPEAFK